MAQEQALVFRTELFRQDRHGQTHNHDAADRNDAAAGKRLSPSAPPVFVPSLSWYNDRF